MGVNGCQGAPWSEELDGKELHGAACDLELREFAASYTSSTWKLTHLMLIQKGWCLIDPLYCCTVKVGPHIALYFPPRTTVLSCILTKLLRTFGFKSICVF